MGVWTTQQALPSLTVVQSAYSSFVSAGDWMTLMFEVRNTSLSTGQTATALALTDNLPAGNGFEWKVARISGGGVCGIVSGPQLKCSLSPLNPGGTVTVTVSTLTSQAACRTYSNSATVAADRVSSITSNSLNFSVLCAPLAIDGPTWIPPGAAGIPYRAVIHATGGTGVYTWSATGLPNGLAIDPATGEITGTPLIALATPATVQVTVTDIDSQSVHQSYTLSVTAFSRCDLDSDSHILAADVIGLATEAFTTSLVHDLDASGALDVLDVQLIVNAAMGRGCAVQ